MTHLSASELKQHPSILSCMPLAQPLAPLRRAKPCRVMFFSRSLRENEPKEGCYPQGPLHRGMQLKNRENRDFSDLHQGKIDHQRSILINNHGSPRRGTGFASHTKTLPESGFPSEAIKPLDKDWRGVWGVV